MYSIEDLEKLFQTIFWVNSDKTGKGRGVGVGKGELNRSAMAPVEIICTKEFTLRENIRSCSINPLASEHTNITLNKISIQCSIGIRSTFLLVQ